MVGPQLIADGLSLILGRHTKPALTLDQDGDRLARLRDPGIIAAAVCLGAYRQASWCVAFLIIFASIMTCLPLELSLDTDGAIYLIFVPLHMVFPNDGTRAQESKQQCTIPRETVECIISPSRYPFPLLIRDTRI